MIELFKTNQSVTAFIARISLGIVMLPHGLQKLLGIWGGKGFAATMEHFQETGLPYLVAIIVILAESIGSLMLLAGFLTRVIALLIMSIMLGAIIKVHGQFGFFMNWSGQQAGEGFEYHLLALALCLILILAGGGRWSVDRFLNR
jgi:putative oxidoreductase